MATNLTPRYHKAEEQYRRAATTEDELHWLEIMYREMPKQKAAEKLQSKLKQKISRTKKELDAERKSGARGIAFAPRGKRPAQRSCSEARTAATPSWSPPCRRAKNARRQSLDAPRRPPFIPIPRRASRGGFPTTSAAKRIPTRRLRP